MATASVNLVAAIAEAVRRAGGRTLLVGGSVRDQLLGLAAKDLDVEIFGLDALQLTQLLANFGAVKRFGASFPVFGLSGHDIDFSLPRAATYAEAARFRDLTINSMGRDVLTGELLDPFGGVADLQSRVLRATDALRFSDDALRGVRVAQLAARLEMEPDAALIRLCQAQDLSAVPGERLYLELQKLLLLAGRPSRGLQVLRTTGLLRFFPELAALPGVPQAVEWHPEGDVWVHTLMVVDEAARLRNGGPHDLTLMLAALLHDVGKPVATQLVDGRVTSRGHDVAGVPLTQAFLERLHAPKERTQAVAMLVRHHLAPAMLVQGEASDRAYRRLIRELHAAGTDAATLLRVARADQLGRTTAAAQAQQFPAGEVFAARVAALGLHVPTVDAVLGRHLIARGYPPGPALGALLRACRALQEQTGWNDPERLMDQVLRS